MKCGRNSTTEKSGSFYNRLLQGVLLKVEMLLVRGDACVSDVHKVACLNVKNASESSVS